MKKMKHFPNFLAFVFWASFMLYCCVMQAENGKIAVNDLLRKDGTLDLRPGISGTMDLSGFSVEMDPCRGPVFSPMPVPSVWSSLDQGMGNGVLAMAVSGTDVYVGGWFSSVGEGGTPVEGLYRVAKWDGTVWSALGQGLAGHVYAIAVSGTDVYFGGQFSGAYYNDDYIELNRIAKWDGTAWSALDKGLNNQVSSIAVSGTDIYVAGDFTNVGSGGVPVSGLNSVAKWNGTAWSALDHGLYDGAKVIATNGTEVYVGGAFTAIGPGADPVEGLNHIARWDGTSWSALDHGFNRVVTSIVIAGTDIYAGGHFTEVGAGGTLVSGLNRIARWNGTAWSPLDAGINGGIEALASNGTELYVAGSFTGVGAGGTPVTGLNSIARWDGTSWSALGHGLGTYQEDDPALVMSLAIQGPDIYAGGLFYRSGPGSTPLMNLSYIAKWGAPSCISPTAFAVSGGGQSCSGSTVAIGLSGSETSVTYQLKRGATDVGSAVSGTGSALTFPAQNAAGSYTIVAARTTGGCTSDMTGSAVITAATAVVYYEDSDGDTYGNSSLFVSNCTGAPSGYVTNNTDCNDSDPLEKPGQLWYADVDNDGYSNGTTLTQCARPAGYKLAAEMTATTGDCNDNDNVVYPGATDLCDSKDNDCDGTTDEGNNAPFPGWGSGNVGGATNTSNSFDCNSGSSSGTQFNLTSQGFSGATNIDMINSSYQQRCGDVVLTARIASSPAPGWAGIYIRESLAANSKMVALKTNLSSFLRRETRATTNGGKSTSQNAAYASNTWMRIERIGNTFNFYTSPNGSAWTFFGSTSITMTSCVYLGVFAESINASTTITAHVDNISITGGTAPLARNPDAAFELREQQTMDVVVYPNPSSGDLFLQVKNPDFYGQSLQVQLINAVGAQLWTGNLENMENTTQLSGLPDLSGGIYWIRMQAPGFAPTVQRIVIQH